jgi:hypothetical protein
MKMTFHPLDLLAFTPSIDHHLDSLLEHLKGLKGHRKTPSHLQLVNFGQCWGY